VRTHGFAMERRCLRKTQRSHYGYAARATRRKLSNPTCSLHYTPLPAFLSITPGGEQALHMHLSAYEKAGQFNGSAIANHPVEVRGHRITDLFPSVRGGRKATSAADGPIGKPTVSRGRIRPREQLEYGLSVVTFESSRVQVE